MAARNRGLDELCAQNEDSPVQHAAVQSALTTNSAKEKPVEVEAEPPDQNPHEDPIYRRSNLDEIRTREHTNGQLQSNAGQAKTSTSSQSKRNKRSRRILSALRSFLPRCHFHSLSSRSIGACRSNNGLVTEWRRTSTVAIQGAALSCAGFWGA